MTTFLGTDETGNVDLPESGRKRSQDRVACFLHLRDLNLSAPWSSIGERVAFVQTLEAKVIAEKAARESRLTAARERVERLREADRQKAAPFTVP
jgi:hypothetical protein